MDNLTYKTFTDESQLLPIIELIEKDLSEPYSIYTYRYFIYSFPELTICAYNNDEFVGVVVGRIDVRQSQERRGYIAMLAVKPNCRKLGIATILVQKILEKMKIEDVDVCALETEVCNKGALRLYEKLGFCREKRLDGYYINGNDAFRLKCFFR